MDSNKTTSGKAGRIDIYVDGSWLGKGKQNPVETGGWGAVIIDSLCPDHPRYMSNPTSEGASSSYHAEMEAALGALKSVQAEEFARDNPPSEVVLHTDQFSLVQGHRLPLELKSFVDKMNVQIVYTPDPKMAAKGSRGASTATTTDLAYISRAHELSRHAAWMGRLAKQGYVFLGNERLEGAEVEKALSYQASSVMPERYRSSFARRAEYPRGGHSQRM